MCAPTQAPPKRAPKPAPPPPMNFPPPRPKTPPPRKASPQPKSPHPAKTPPRSLGKERPSRKRPRLRRRRHRSGARSPALLELHAADEAPPGEGQPSAGMGCDWGCFGTRRGGRAQAASAPVPRHSRRGPLPSEPSPTAQAAGAIQAERTPQQTVEPSFSATPNSPRPASGLSTGPAGSAAWAPPKSPLVMHSYPAAYQPPGPRGRTTCDQGIGESAPSPTLVEHGTQAPRASRSRRWSSVRQPPSWEPRRSGPAPLTGRHLRHRPKRCRRRVPSRHLRRTCVDRRRPRRRRRGVPMRHPRRARTNQRPNASVKTP